MKRFLLTLMAMMLLLPVSMRADYNPEDDYKYELENVKKGGASTAGYVTLKVWSYGKREKLTRNKCMANAVHGILFKGLDADAVGTAGNEPALVPAGYNSNSEYFDRFFQNDYLQFVQTSNKGAMGAGDVIKVTKKEYKVGMIVTINMTALRKRLENDGIVQSARSLFER